MKEKICVSIGKNHFYNCTTNTIGRNGENECTEFELTLSEELKDNWLYLDFKKPDGSTFKTPRLEIKENKAFYEVPYALLDQKGELSVQVVLQNEDGVIWKSSVKTYYVKESINATEDIENKEDFITEAQSLLDDMTETLGELEDYTETKKQELNTELTNVANAHITNIDTTGSKKVEDINDAASKGTSDINSAGTTALNNISAEKTNAVNDITTLKDTSISDMETKQDELIAELNNEETLARIAELENEIETLYGEFNDNTLEGETVSISDGLAKSKIKVKGNGNSYQETTEGYQAINNVAVNTSRNGIDFTVNKDGSVTINGTSTATSFLVLTNSTNNLNSYTKELLVMQEKYYLKPLSTKYSGIKYGFRTTDGAYIANTNQLAGASIGVIYIEIATGITIENETVYPMLINGSSETKPYEPFTNGVATPNTNHKQDIEVVEAPNIFDKDNANIFIGNMHSIEMIYLANSALKSAYVKIKPNTTYTVRKIASARFAIATSENAPTDNGSISAIQFDNSATKLSITSGKNDKYLTVFYFYNGVDTLSEEEIRNSIMIYKGTKDLPYLPYGHIGLVQRGKNRVSRITQYNPTNEFQPTAIIDFKLEKGKYYILSCDTENTGQYIYINFGESYGLDNVNGWVNNNQKCDGTRKYWVIKGYDDKKYTYKAIINKSSVSNGNTNGVACGYTNNIMIEEIEAKTDAEAKAKFPTEFEPPVEPIVHSIDLAGNSLAKVGEIADLLNIGVDGSVSIGGNVILDTSNNSDNWKMASKNDHIFYKPIIGTNRTTIGISNIYKQVKDQAWETLPDGVFFIANNNLYIKDNRFSSLEDLSNQFNLVPLQILYTLATTETIPLPSISPIELFEGTNIFELVTNLGTTLAVTYKVSNKSRLDNLEKAILSLGGNI